jgi:uncharacterized membrane protein SirB2
MSSYLIVKSLHVLCAALTAASFTTRGIWMWRESPLLQRRWVRVVPHVVDTVLLGSAVALVLITHQYPGPAAWLNAKIAGLILYIVLGSVALRRGRSMRVRRSAFVAALCVLAYIAVVARTRQPLPFLE